MNEKPALWRVFHFPFCHVTLRAETEGFEPSEPFTARLVSSEVLSTTQPRLREYYGITFSLMRQCYSPYLVGASGSKGFHGRKECCTRGGNIVQHYIGLVGNNGSVHQKGILEILSSFLCA